MVLRRSLVLRRRSLTLRLWRSLVLRRRSLTLRLWRCLALRGRLWALGLRLRRRLALWRRLRMLGLRLRRCLALGHRLRPLGLRLWRYLTLRRWVLWQGLLMLRHGLLRHGTSGGWLLSALLLWVHPRLLPARLLLWVHPRLLPARLLRVHDWLPPALLLRAHRRLLTTRLLRVDHWLSAPLLLRANRLWWLDGPHRNRGRWADIMIGLKRAALGHNSRTPPIDSREVIAIGLRGLHDLHLGRHRRCVLLAYRNEFRRAWPYRKPARAAVITHAVVDIGDVGGVVDDLVVINVVHDRGIYPVDRTIVVEVISVPIAAAVAGANVTEAVVDAAVVADVAAPISLVESVSAGIEAPIPGCPQGSLVWREDPGAGHPIVALRGVVPVAGGPNIAVAGTHWLFILRQWRRRLLCIGYRLVVGVVVRVRILAAALVRWILVCLIRWILAGLIGGIPILLTTFGSTRRRWRRGRRRRTLVVSTAARRGCR